jgi:hypothetical protein
VELIDEPVAQITHQRQESDP